MEGPFDALAVSLANQERPAPGLAAVAPCGTALTATQVDALGRFADRQVLVAFDADPAGQRATAAAYQLLAPHFTQLRAVVAPERNRPRTTAARQWPAGTPGGDSVTTAHWPMRYSTMA